MKKKIDLIIFDLDGTLIDSKADIVNSVNHMLSALGLPERNSGEIAGFIGKGVRQLMLDCLGAGHSDRLNEATAIYKDIYRAHMFDTTTLYPNVAETLRIFKDKKKTIVSNKSAEFVRLALERFGIERYFLKILGGDDENYRKPNPLPLINLIKEFNAAKEKTIIVGDSPLDVESGRAAGILTCGVTYGIGRKEEVTAARPDFIIDDIGKLKGAIE